MRKLYNYSIALTIGILLAVGSIADAQGAPPAGKGKLTVTWVAPTQNTDSTPITQPLVYRIFAGPSGKESLYRAGVTTLASKLSGLATGVATCVQLMAVEIEGAIRRTSFLTPEVCAIPKPS